MKYYVVADVHGFYTQMINALNENGFDENNPNHKLVICGDAFDRGKENIKMLLYMKKLIEKDKLIYIRGNHEDLLMECLDNMVLYDSDLENFTFHTICDLASYQRGEFVSLSEGLDDYPAVCLSARRTKVSDFIKQHSVNYYETNKYIFVHGYIPTKYNRATQVSKYLPNWRIDATERDWNEARWTNGIKTYVEDDVKEDGKTIVCGHMWTFYGHIRDKMNDWSLTREKEYEIADSTDDLRLFDVYKKDGLICLDGRVVQTGRVLCVVLDD